MLKDIRYGLRSLWRNPGFALLAILSLALGIGANTAIFSIVNGVLLNALPYADPDQLIRIFERSDAQPRFPMNGGNFQDFRAQNTTLSDMALYTRQDLELSQDDRPERLAALQITSGYFNLLRVQPLLGREFTRDNEVPDSGDVVILSHAVWQRRFQSDLQIIGKKIILIRRPFTVVGVMPEGLQHVGGDYRSMPHGETVDAWWPVQIPPNASRGSHFMNAIGRLKPGVSPAQAESDLKMIAGRLAEQFPNSNEGWSIAVKPLHEEIVGRARTMLLVLFAAVFFVLLIACVNVANLLLARATVREREIAVRASLGAGRGRLVRQLLTESLMLATLGGIVGTMISMWAIDAVARLGPELLPRAQTVSLDGRILFFTLGVTVVTGILFGLAPAWQAGSVSLAEVIKEGGRGGTGSIRQRRLRNALVITEVALALVLTAGAGLLIRSFWNLHKTDHGFRPARVLTAQLGLPRALYSEANQVVAFQEQLLDRVRAQTGVVSAGMTSDLPWTGYDENRDFLIEGKMFPSGHEPDGRYHFVTPEYFKTIGVPIISGRDLQRTDRDGTSRVMLVNQKLAKTWFPNEDAVGKRVSFVSNPADKDWVTIAGVVGDVKDTPNSMNAVSAFYLPMSQVPVRGMILAINTTGDPSRMIETVRREVSAMDRNLPVSDITTLDTISATALARQRFTLILVSFFAISALALSALGIYGVLSYLVAQRRQELGVRIALGARVNDVLKLVVRQGMTLAISGVALGLIASFWLTRMMQGLLFEVRPFDPLTLGVVAVILVIVSFIACWLPARRATKVDPIETLRYE